MTPTPKAEPMSDEQLHEAAAEIAEAIWVNQLHGGAYKIADLARCYAASQRPAGVPNDTVPEDVAYAFDRIDDFIDGDRQLWSSTEVQAMSTIRAHIEAMASDNLRLNSDCAEYLKVKLELQGDLDLAQKEIERLRGAIQQHSESTHQCEYCGAADPCDTDDVCLALAPSPAEVK